MVTTVLPVQNTLESGTVSGGTPCYFQAKPHSVSTCSPLNHCGAIPDTNLFVCIFEAEHPLCLQVEVRLRLCIVMGLRQHRGEIYQELLCLALYLLVRMGACLCLYT